MIRPLPYISRSLWLSGMIIKLVMKLGRSQHGLILRALRLQVFGKMEEQVFIGVLRRALRQTFFLILPTPPATILIKHSIQPGEHIPVMTRIAELPLTPAELWIWQQAEQAVLIGI